MSKLSLLIDKKDYIKRITEDDVVNIIGLKGSGKTTSVVEYLNDDSYIVVNCDALLELPENNRKEDKLLFEIRNKLIKKYGEIKTNKEFIDCYNDIVSYAKNKNKKLLIEGNLILEINPISKLKGTVIIKRTGIIKCFIRTIKRDYPNKYFLDLEIEKYGKILGRFSRLKNIIKRRIKIFKEKKDIELIIKELDIID